MVSSTPKAPAPSAPSGGAKRFTWQEVAQHNTEESCWVIVGLKVYDVTKWLPEHPGGKETLLLAAGRDCTDLFTCYHPFTDKPTAVLAKYLIGEMDPQSLEFPQYKPDSGFYKELRAKVGDYFRQTGLHPKDPLPGSLRLIGILAVAALSFYVAHCDRFNWNLRLLAGVIFGIAQALPLLHCMHDASHTSIGYSQGYWAFFGRLTMDWFAGASMTSWHHQHVVGHHLYTNVYGADPDLPVARSGDIRRVTDHQVWSGLYRFQHLYLGPLYSLLGLKFRVQDIVGVLTLQNGPIRLNVKQQRELAYQAAVKITWFCWRFVLPAYLGLSLTEILVLFFMAELTTGCWLAFNFQVSHVSPSTVFPSAETKEPFADEWAVSQVKTTVDYAHGDLLATFLCGALNYQTVHHLFPSVSQYHYPALAPIVLEVCKRHGVRYNHIQTFREAVYLHFKHLYDLGQKTAA